MVPAVGLSWGLVTEGFITLNLISVLLCTDKTNLNRSLDNMLHLCFGRHFAKLDLESF